MNCKTISEKSTILSCLIHLSIYTFTVSSLSVPASLAQQSPAAGSNTSASAELRRYNIPAQPLSEALIEFGKQSGLQVNTGSVLVEGKQAPSVSGTLSAEQALNQLLAGNDLRYKVSGGMVRLTSNEKASVPEIVVFGRGIETSLRDVPQSTVTFDRAFLENTFAVELRDAVRFIPGGATDRPANGTYTQAVQSRGFASNYVVNSQSPLDRYPGYDPAGLERIEVLQGPASVLYGSMEPGATINLITKKPRAKMHFGVGIDLGSYNAYRSTVDLGGPLSDRVRVRLNAAYDSRETFYDFWKRKRIYLAPVVEVDITDRTQMTLEASYGKFTDENGVNDARYPAVGTVLPNPNGQIPRTFSPVQPGLGDWNQSVSKYSAALTHELNDNWTLSAYVDHQRVYAGGLFWFANAFQPDLRTLKRLLFVTVPEPEHSTFSTASIAGEFQTGPIAHSLIIGTDYLDLEFKNIRGISALKGIDAFNPIRDKDIVVPTPNSRFRSSDKAYGVFSQNRMKIGDRLTALVGVRWSEVESLSAFGAYPTLPKLTGVKQDNISTQFGLVYDVADSVTLYASRATSFKPRGGNSFGGAPFEPETGIQYEVGAKLFPFDGMSASLALFNIEKPNVVVPDPSNFGFAMQIGEIKSRGIELALSGNAVDGLLLHATYAYLDTESVGGFNFSTSPKNTVGLFARYNFSAVLDGFSLSGSVQYRDDIFQGTNEELTLPSYTRADFGIHYSFSESIEVNVQIKNAFDAEIWNSTHQTNAAPGEPRTVTAGIRFKM